MSDPRRPYRRRIRRLQPDLPDLSPTSSPTSGLVLYGCARPSRPFAVARIGFANPLYTSCIYKKGREGREGRAKPYSARVSASPTSARLPGRSGRERFTGIAGAFARGVDLRNGLTRTATWSCGSSSARRLTGNSDRVRALVAGVLQGGCGGAHAYPLPPSPRHHRRRSVPRTAGQPRATALARSRRAFPAGAGRATIARAARTSGAR